MDTKMGIINKDRPVLSLKDRHNLLYSILKAGCSEKTNPQTARLIENKKRNYHTYIRALKPSCSERKPFIVADTETILIDNIHCPYAIGLLLVRPGEEMKDIMIDTYFSEDYRVVIEKFEDRSTKLLYDFILRIATIVKKERNPLTIFFHNFSRFDGIILLKHLACHHPSYKLKPLMRNSRLYEIAVYSEKSKLLFKFRDSLNLLPGKLSVLAKSLCPELGSKGDIPHDQINLSNLVSKKKELIDYMKQDILLLGGIMKKAQSIYFELYKVDIESKITISSLALTIFRIKYYDADNCPIHIPNQNEDTFIRRGYYGGHVDVYKPYGKGLYYYDINSLYPYVMKEYSMPGGVPVWHGNLDGKDLDSLYGFIEAYIICPDNIDKPFLPYKDKDGTLLFPTGEFVGVYYSEELKYARRLGYTVIPLTGYLFEKIESPLRNFVCALYESRLDARKCGNDALSYVYKILMNSLYGRFGINPKSTTTEICDQDRRNELIYDDIIFEEMINETNYMVAYHSNTGSGKWDPPKNSAVQLAAAITACSRIQMYSYISRNDCYYTDTDSVVLAHSLPDEDVHSSILGKFKLEHFLTEGLFLAPKTYCYETDKGEIITKHKGAASAFATYDWFRLQYQDPSRTKKVNVISNFWREMRFLRISKKERAIELGTSNRKRHNEFENGEWVGTRPIYITDLSSLDYCGKQIIKSLRNQIKQLQIENSILKKKLAILSTPEEEKQEEETTELTNPKEHEEKTIDHDKTEDEKLTLHKKKWATYNTEMLEQERRERERNESKED